MLTLKAAPMLIPNDIGPDVIRVHVTDSDEDSQRDIANLLVSTRDIALVSHASGVEETLQDVRMARPTVVLVDLGLPDRGATQIVRRVLEEHPTTGIVVRTLHDEKQCLLEYLNWGARGFLLKPSTPESTFDAIRAVHRGERFVDPSLPHCLVSHYMANPSQLHSHGSTQLDVLTIREREVCRYLAYGYTNAEVAEALCISKRTVETHRAAIMSKVGAKSRAQLVHLVITNGLWNDPGAQQVANARHLHVGPGE